MRNAMLCGLVLVLAGGCGVIYMDPNLEAKRRAELDEEERAENISAMNMIQTARPTSIKEVNDLEDRVRKVVTAYDYKPVKGHMARKRKSWYLDYHTDRPDTIVTAINDEKLVLGMSWPDVWAFKGRPNDINRTTSAHGTDEQWVYRDSWEWNSRIIYLYFDNGVLASWQD